ncbi:MAG: hypothetical protein BGO41_00710 [Clostridiales bacterium 38-18]|nr:MAG: hypothetical protein BGO41_00710 [Clostridiales bacterium 38-18]
MNIDELLKNNFPYYAHTRKDHKETLIEHSELTMSYFRKLIKVHLDPINNMLENYIISNHFESKRLLPQAVLLFENAVYLHDIGKINRNFQIINMNNTSFGEYPSEDSHHSIYSALIYIHVFKTQIEMTDFSRQEKKLLIKLMVGFAYIISRHHGYLSTLADFASSVQAAIERITLQPNLIGEYVLIDDLISEGEQIIISVEKGLQRVNSQDKVCQKVNDTLLGWLIDKTLYSYIVTCDFYATGHYMNQKPITSFGEINCKVQFAHKYHNSPLVQRIKNQTHSNDVSEINQLRTKMLMESECQFLRNIKESIFYLEAPTGCGKTITSINLAVKAIESDEEINRIFYVFPFNTLVDQTAETLYGLFDFKDIAVINSLEAIKKDTQEDYNKAYLDHIMLHFPITVTSHVNFFGMLTGVSRESHLMLSHLKNSVVIIDEIQSYKNILWYELIEIMHLFATFYNIKFIIMSATLPKMSKMIGAYGVDLIEDPDVYFKHPIFMNRTQPDFSLLKEEMSLEKLADMVRSKISNGQDRILIEFIDKINARLFFNVLMPMLVDTEYEIYELTGDDPSYFRQKLIGALKSVNDKGEFRLKKVVVIATQVIEAGIDIDMSMGFKDVSLIDSEEQFAGRINRSCTKDKAIIYFFDIFNERLIYKNDVRIAFSVREHQARQWYSEKDFNSYFEAVLKQLNVEKQRFNVNNIQRFFQLAIEGNFIEIQKYMKLIDQENVTIFIPRRIELEDYVLEGEKIWESYKGLLEEHTISYPEKQILLSQQRRTFSYFTYQVKYRPLEYVDSINERIFLLKKDAYHCSDKFDRKQYNDSNSKGNFSAEELIL